MAPDMAETLVTGRTPATLRASRVKKARRSRACAGCGAFYPMLEQVGYVEGLGWCCMPCVTGPGSVRLREARWRP
jgi:hypothetical protein